MKRIVALFVLLVVVATLFVGVKPASAKPSVSVGVSCQNTNVSVSVSAIGATDISFWVDAYKSAPNYDFIGSFGRYDGTSANIPALNDADSVWVYVSYYDGGWYGDWYLAACNHTHLFNDGRLDQDGAFQSVALYCDGTTLIAYAMFESKGYLAFKITQAEIDKFPTHPSHNTLIKQAKGVRLYRLTSGELQINRATPDGKQYSIMVHTCVH